MINNNKCPGGMKGRESEGDVYTLNTCYTSNIYLKLNIHYIKIFQDSLSVLILQPVSVPKLGEWSSVREDQGSSLLISAYIGTVK